MVTTWLCAMKMRACNYTMYSLSKFDLINNLIILIIDDIIFLIINNYCQYLNMNNKIIVSC